ncbi:MAG: hypothetical protein KDA21_00035 [Phycisphaerales bacterium]|nr:hypothetical protein [Phycisphaerales bacterium]
MVGHGDVPEKVKISQDIMTMGPRRTPDVPGLGDPLHDIDAYPDLVSDKPLPGHADRNTSGSRAGSGSAAVPTPGSLSLIGLAATGLLRRRRRPLTR